jgi:hypothetical protein
MHKKSAGIVLTLSLACGIANAAEEVSTPVLKGNAQPSALQNDIATDGEFFKTLSTMESNSFGASVEENFKKVLEKPSTYLGYLTKKYQFLVEHAPFWYGQIGAASESAKKADWAACRTEASKGLKEKPDSPALLLLRAVAEKNLNKNEDALLDLRQLYIVKAKKEQNKKVNSFYQKDEREFFDFLLL